jgi:hypothetical protein
MAIPRRQLRDNETNNHDADRCLDIASLINREPLVRSGKEEIEPKSRSDTRGETRKPIPSDRNRDDDNDEKECGGRIRE